MPDPADPARFGPPERYRSLWRPWVRDPLIEQAGLTFDRTPSGPVTAPPGQFRVCAWHIDFDERPTFWLDVSTRAEAIYICENFAEAAAGRNVDIADAYDDTGTRIFPPDPDE